ERPSGTVSVRHRSRDHFFLLTGCFFVAGTPDGSAGAAAELAFATRRAGTKSRTLASPAQGAPSSCRPPRRRKRPAARTPLFPGSYNNARTTTQLSAAPRPAATKDVIRRSTAQGPTSRPFKSDRTAAPTTRRLRIRATPGSIHVHVNRSASVVVCG